VEHDLVIYDGAPHGFFDRKYEEYADDSEDAWRRTLEFIERHAALDAD
jgi:carboxymethylenebutenolidase